MAVDDESPILVAEGGGDEARHRRLPPAAVHVDADRHGCQRPPEAHRLHGPVDQDEREQDEDGKHDLVLEQQCVGTVT